jgi:hypothetical protein
MLLAENRIPSARPAGHHVPKCPEGAVNPLSLITLHNFSESVRTCFLLLQFHCVYLSVCLHTGTPSAFKISPRGQNLVNPN